MKDVSPELTAEITLYPTEQGGRKGPTPPDWFGCPCFISKEHLDGLDCCILPQGMPLSRDETRRVGMVLLSPDIVIPALRRAGKSYLWEGHVIGEGIPV